MTVGSSCVESSVSISEPGPLGKALGKGPDRYQEVEKGPTRIIRLSKLGDPLSWKKKRIDQQPLVGGPKPSKCFIFPLTTVVREVPSLATSTSFAFKIGSSLF